VAARRYKNPNRHTVVADIDVFGGRNHSAVAIYSISKKNFWISYGKFSKAESVMGLVYGNER